MQKTGQVGLFDETPFVRVDEEFRHPQVPVEWRGRTYWLDVEIAPLLLSLWELGLWTDYSCQGDNDVDAYILFKRTTAAERFLVIVAGQERDDRLYQRIGRIGRARTSSLLPFPKTWRASVSMNEPWRGVAVPGEEFDRMFLRCSVEFPHEDLAEVTERVQAQAQLLHDRVDRAPVEPAEDNDAKRERIAAARAAST